MKFEQGIHIVEEIGKVATADAAKQVLKEKLDSEHYQRITRLNNPHVLKIVANAIVMCRPDNVYINTGSNEDKLFLKEMALEKGEESDLPMEGHTVHYDLKEEQGRIVDRTYYIANEGEPVSSLGLRMPREEALETVKNGMVFRHLVNTLTKV